MYSKVKTHFFFFSFFSCLEKGQILNTQQAPRQQNRIGTPKKTITSKITHSWPHDYNFRWHINIKLDGFKIFTASKCCLFLHHRCITLKRVGLGKVKGSVKSSSVFLLFLSSFFFNIISFDSDAKGQ